jgi:hypothetical protein
MENPKELEFSFSMLTKRQLVKLAAAYNVKVNGALFNTSDPLEDILKAVNEELTVLEDGSIVRKDSKEAHKEIKLEGGAKVRMIIL